MSSQIPLYQGYEYIIFSVNKGLSWEMCNGSVSFSWPALKYCPPNYFWHVKTYSIETGMSFIWNPAISAIQADTPDTWSTTRHGLFPGCVAALSTCVWLRTLQDTVLSAVPENRRIHFSGGSAASASNSVILRHWSYKRMFWHPRKTWKSEIWRPSYHSCVS